MFFARDAYIKAAKIFPNVCYVLINARALTLYYKSVSWDSTRRWKREEEESNGIKTTLSTVGSNDDECFFLEREGEQKMPWFSPEFRFEGRVLWFYKMSTNPSTFLEWL